MSPRATELESSKASGDALESDLIQQIAPLEFVDDRTATWHDARTSTLVVPSTKLPFYGICLLERGTPIEIKGCQIETGNGSRSTRGRFYIKYEAHRQLLEAAGSYLLVVYVPRPGLPQVARAIVPASLVDELLRGRWYDVDGNRSEKQVAKLAWNHVIDPETIDPAQPIEGVVR
ncbi:hypothetical protein [Natronosalvus amylolyticus]|uniref:hypothetical protein n=1 Tax=Natronosalvus amylolyticus TaxID=2961994 RepID=UPI0020C9A876|nr:hypothetical protein [Natronosalvus amylolyticus]